MTTVPTRTVAPTARGPVSTALLEILTGPEETPASGYAALSEATATAVNASQDVLADEDLQLSLFLLYLLHYGPAEFVTADREWDPELLRVRTVLEAGFEAELRRRVPLPDPLPGDSAQLVDTMFAMTGGDAKPTLATWLARHPSEEILSEFLVHRSIYTLREADPHSWGIARLRGRAKAALVEIQSDEYGGGRPERVHATIFAQTMRGFGLDDTPDHYLDLVPAPTLASMNLMSLFGLHRRLRGAIAGHLAAFEMTSSIPNKYYGRAFRKLGYDADVTWYYDEHVEADAVHEQIAARDLAGALAQDEPELLEDVLFGAAACLYVDGLMGDHMLECWSDGRTSLRGSMPGLQTVGSEAPVAERVAL